MRATGLLIARPDAPSSRPSDLRASLGIVIVNWNAGHYLRECLESLIRCDGLDRVSRVVVVDNASHDRSCENLPILPVPFQLIQNDSNRGFAAACNQGAELCEASCLLFLNPDTVLHANSLRVPLEFLDDAQHADVGICGIQLLNEKGEVGRTCSRLPTCTSLVAMALRLQSPFPRIFPPHFMKEWDHSETRDVEEVIGAFFVVRQDLFQRLHGFDERFFVYFEEVDFCERAKRLGYRTMFLSTAQAEHAGGACSNQIRGRSLFYSLRSRVLYANKHMPVTQAAMVARV
jgi:N-acetylglucosaminyl-diphospho-decaprenol L-rhamnosyltransferase